MKDNVDNKLLLFEEFESDSKNDGCQLVIKGFEEYCNTIEVPNNTIDNLGAGKIDRFLSFIDKNRQMPDNDRQIIEKKDREKNDLDEGDSDSNEDSDKKEENEPEPQTPSPSPQECIPLPQMSIPNSSLM